MARLQSPPLRVLFSPLVLAMIALATLGLVNLRGMTAPEHIDRLFNMQLCWLGLSLLAGAAAVVIDPRTVERLGYHIFALGVALLLAVLIFGDSINGARRWLDFVVIHLQPSELMKLLLVIGLARYVADNPRGGVALSLRDLLVPGLMTALPMALILWQPDLSSAVILALIAATLVVVAGLRGRAMAALLAAAVVAAPLVWAFGLHAYQRARVLAFLIPGGDPMGTGWQTRQSLIALGSGGWLGRGLGQSTQVSFVPCHNDDLPFSIFGEERGLVGALLVLGLYLVLCLLCVRTSRAARDRFGAMVAAGVGVMIFWQVLVNLGVTLGVMPPTGVALPFFSTGGSAVFTTTVGLGLVLGIGLRSAGTAGRDASSEESLSGPPTGGRG